MASAPEPSKRRTLKLLASGTGCAAAAVIGVPSAGWLSAPAPDPRPSESPFRATTLRPSELEPDRPRRVRLGEHVVWLVRSGSRLRAFSARCPHLGCSVGLAEDRRFSCPCHGASFGLDGGRLDEPANPAPRGMDELETRVDAGRGVILVRVVQYLPGVPSRIPVRGGP